MNKLRFQDFLLRRPIVDQLAPIAILLAWFFLFDRATLGSDDGQIAAFVGLSAVAGIVLAAATFVCTMLYQSSSSSVRLLREHFRGELAKSWTSVFVFLFIAAVVPIIAAVVRDSHETLAFGLVLYSAGILLGRGFRTYLWLIVSFRLESAPEPPQRTNFETKLKPRSK